MSVFSGSTTALERNVITIKGTVDDPITSEEVNTARERFVGLLREYGIEADSLGLAMSPTSQSADLVGYGIRYNESTESTTEIIRTVPEPISSSELERVKIDNEVEELERNDYTVTEIDSTSEESERGVFQAESRADTTTRANVQDRSHEDIDQFAQDAGRERAIGSTSQDPSPSWNPVGRIDKENTCLYENYRGNVYELGYIDLFGELCVSSGNEEYYVAKQHLTQYPGTDYPDGRNDSNNVLTKMVNNYISLNDWVNIREFGPTKPKTSSIDWNVGVSAGGTGGSGTVTASYDVPYISRDTIIDRDQYKRGNKYEYPSSVLDPFDAEAKKNTVALENICSATVEHKPDFFEDVLGQDGQPIIEFDALGSFSHPSELGVGVEVSGGIIRSRLGLATFI